MFIIEKSPIEETTIGVDVSAMREFVAGETIASVLVTATLAGVTADVVENSAIDGLIVRVRLSGGVAAKDYGITVLITTSGGHVREIVFQLHVREKRNKFL